VTTVQDVWPPAGIVVRTPRLELRWPSADDLLVLAAVAAEGIHDAAAMPFAVPWTRGTPDDVARSVLRWNWQMQGTSEPERWSWQAVAVVDGRVVGTQGIQATDYAVRRTVETGSWLGRTHQGRGIGKEMRAAMLHLAFAGLDAERAETGAHADNAASLGVTRSVGYRDNGDRIVVVEGQRQRELLFVMDRSQWEARRRDDIELTGVAEARPFFGLPAEDAPESQVEAAERSG
jgi:RimJ/RimL family protein N-acetyltransferase